MTSQIKDKKKIGRLKKRADFLLMNTKGKRWVTPAFAVQVLEKESETPYLVGFTATKKFSKRAVDRNRAKRRLRALVEENLSQLAKEGYAYVFIARDECLNVSFEQMKQDLRWALKRLECLARTFVR